MIDPTLGLWTGAGSLLYFQDDGHTIGTTASNGTSYSQGNGDSCYSYDLAAGDSIVALPPSGTSITGLC